MPKKYINFAKRMSKEGYNIVNLGSLLHYIVNEPKNDDIAYSAVINALDSICEQTDKLFCPPEAIEQYFPHLIEALLDRKGERYTEDFLSTLHILFDGVIKIDALNDWKARQLKKVAFLPRAMSLIMCLDEQPEVQDELIDFFECFPGYEKAVNDLRRKSLNLSTQNVTEETGVNIAEVVETSNVIHFKIKEAQTPLSA